MTYVQLAYGTSPAGTIGPNVNADWKYWNMWNVTDSQKPRLSTIGGNESRSKDISWSNECLIYVTNKAGGAGAWAGAGYWRMPNSMNEIRLSAGGKRTAITECSTMMGTWGPSSRGELNDNNAGAKYCTGWAFWNIGCLRLSTYLPGGRWHGHSSPTAAAREVGVDQLHDKGSLFADGRSQHGKHLPVEDGWLSICFLGGRSDDHYYRMCRVDNDYGTLPISGDFVPNCSTNYKGKWGWLSQLEVSSITAHLV